MKTALFCAFVLSLSCGPVAADTARTAVSTDVGPATAVPGIGQAQLSADYWLVQHPDPDAVIFAAAAVARHNARLAELDDTLNNLATLPLQMTADDVRQRVGRFANQPEQPLWDEHGQPVPSDTLAGIVANIGLDRIAAATSPRFGLVLRRANLRGLPTSLRVFSSQGDTDIDRLQETALFPGTPVAIVHRSRDGAWLFAISPLYSAWIQTDDVAEGERAQVIDYANAEPSLLVIGAVVRTVFTPERPALSELRLDMGTRLPIVTDWPANRPLNGQNPYTGTTVLLPVRAADGSLALAPALVPGSAEVSRSPLPLTGGNLVRQAFRFLGERYGWGHGYDGRDCSGFVSEVYRSMGVVLPRNSRDQGLSPALDRASFSETSSSAERQAGIASLKVGDLVYIPGHVMMVVGHVAGEPYVIHDTTGMSVRDAAGQIQRIVLNGVSVTPLQTLLFNDTQTYTERMYSIVRIRPTKARTRP